MLSTHQGYNEGPKHECSCAEDKRTMLDSIQCDLEWCINKLATIDGKMGYTEDYEEGYKDACVAIKNSVRTIINKAKENVSR